MPLMCMVVQESDIPTALLCLLRCEMRFFKENLEGVHGEECTLGDVVLRDTWPAPKPGPARNVGSSCNLPSSPSSHAGFTLIVFPCVPSGSIRLWPLTSAILRPNRGLCVLRLPLIAGSHLYEFRNESTKASGQTGTADHMWAGTGRRSSLCLLCSWHGQRTWGF